MTPGPGADQQVGVRSVTPVDEDDQDPGATWMVRSEERARVAFPTRVRGRVRLVKQVVAEEVTQTFLLRREVLRVEERPAGADEELLSYDAPLLDDQSGRDFEIVLHAEQVVTSTVVVPVERVRVTHRLATSEAVVSTDIHREQIEVEHDLGSAPAAGVTTAAGGTYDDHTGATEGRARTSKEEPA